AVKVADGIIATAGLYRQALLQGGGIIAPDTFQQVRKAKQEASIKFLINQAQLRKSELKNNSVQEFVKLLGKINADAEKYNLQDVEVLAYASPDGGEQYNTELAGKRQKESVKYVDSQLKANKVNAPITGNYTAQDWEGFQQLVAASDIQDKELILRVLSMYKDPQEREQQIKNLSQGFRDLADQILPQLRRSRMIINYESIGRSDEQIEAQYNTTTGVLSADEILYYATLVSNIDKKEEIYTKCAQIYPNDYRAYNNVAAVKLAKGDMESARFYLQRALAADPQAGEPQSNYALIALKNGNVSEAESFLSKAGRSAGLNEVQGAVNLVKGNYKQAAENYNGVYNNMAALSQILAEDYASARATFNQIGKQGDGLTDYLHAILGARQENKYAATSYLQDAFSKNPSLKAYYDDDLEFVNVKE
ncbi:MAG: tetratricopeptide repeat protein, partial [Prevotella sp.]|nr:tetratricopeptide repeat protein [Prevotella sp.]